LIKVYIRGRRNSKRAVSPWLGRRPLHLHKVADHAFFSSCFSYSLSTSSTRNSRMDRDYGLSAGRASRFPAPAGTRIHGARLLPIRQGTRTAFASFRIVTPLQFRIVPPCLPFRAGSIGQWPSSLINKSNQTLDVGRNDVQPPFETKFITGPSVAKLRRPYSANSAP